jgi:hypothetical protein
MVYITPTKYYERSRDIRVVIAAVVICVVGGS